MKPRRLATALVAALLVALPTGPAEGAKRMEVGVQDDPVLVDGSYYDRETALTQSEQIGVTRIRVNLSWWEAAGATRDSRTVPRRVPWDWARYDSLIDAAARHGMRLQMTLTGPAPAWATADLRLGIYGPSPRRYAEFARAAARHFKGRVDRYALWNEPNHVAWMSPHELSAALYRDIYIAGYRAIKRVDRRAKVLLGELVPYETTRAIPPLTFLRDMSCATLLSPGDLRRPPRLAAGPCPGLKTDGVAMHPYDYQRPPSHPYPDSDSATVGSLGYFTGTLRSLARVGALRTPRGGVAPTYLTEFGYFNSGRYRLSDSRRSKYLVQAYRIAARNPLVRQMTQYTLVTPPPGFLGGYFDLSLIDPQGRTMAPFRALSRWTKVAVRRGQIARRGGPIRLPAAPRG